MVTQMAPTEMRMLIEELKRDTIHKVYVSKARPRQVMLADRFEILAIDRTTAKKLSDEELRSLVAYGQGYTEQYKDGKFMFRKGPGGTSLADLDEAGTFNEMDQVVGILKAELNRRI
jgi:hypothetical protein